MIDDQPAMRAGLVRLIAARFPSHLEVHTADSPASARSQLALTLPQVAVLDVDLAGSDGLALILDMPDDCRVLVFTSQKDLATRTRAMSLGATFFLEKGAPASALLDCLSALLPTEMQGEHPPGSSGDSSAMKKNGVL